MMILVDEWSLTVPCDWLKEKTLLWSVMNWKVVGKEL